VLAGTGLARALAWGRRPLILGLLAAGAIVTALQLPGRAAELPHALTSTARIAHSHQRLTWLVQTVGREELLRCGRLATSDVLVRTALAWELEVPLGDVVSFGEPPRSSGAFIVGPEASSRVRSAMAERGRLLYEQGEWSAYSIDCPPTAAAGSSRRERSPGVSGARR